MQVDVPLMLVRLMGRSWGPDSQIATNNTASPKQTQGLEVSLCVLDTSANEINESAAPTGMGRFSEVDPRLADMRQKRIFVNRSN